MNILLLLVPLSLVLLGVAIWAFVWAVRRGQFDDLDTPALDILATMSTTRPTAATACRPARTDMPLDWLVAGRALLSGLLGGVHCAAMCGGIATGFSALAAARPAGGGAGTQPRPRARLRRWRARSPAASAAASLSVARMPCAGARRCARRSAWCW